MHYRIHYVTDNGLVYIRPISLLDSWIVKYKDLRDEIPSTHIGFIVQGSISNVNQKIRTLYSSNVTGYKKKLSLLDLIARVDEPNKICKGFLLIYFKSKEEHKLRSETIEETKIIESL